MSANTLVYSFPGNTVISNQDISGLTIDACEMFRGGIGWGANASKLLAHGMESIGNSESSFSLPYSLEAHDSSYGFGVDQLKYQFINSKDQKVPNDKAKEFIQEKISEGVRCFSLPLDFNGHASLAHVVVSEDGNSAKLYYFDSLSQYEEKQYQQRYDSITTAIKSVFVQSIEGYEVHHILDQGGPNSSGCGYYTLKTASLLKEKPVTQLIDEHSLKGAYLYTNEDDVRIRCECAIQAVLYRRPNSTELEKFQYTQEFKTVFHRLGYTSMKKCIEFLKENEGAVFYSFPKNSIISNQDVSGLRIDVQEMFRGGIGWGASASKLLAHGMESIGSSKSSFSLPYSLEGLDSSYGFGVDQLTYKFINSSDQEVFTEKVKKFIQERVFEGVSCFSLPLNFNGHASLLHVVISEGEEPAKLYYFDSSSEDEENEYQERYDSITIAIKSIFSQPIDGYGVHHILDQGGPYSKGGGYYTLKTATLLTEKTVVELLNEFKSKGTYLYTQEDDVRIRCECAVQAILHFGHQSVDLEKFQYTQEFKTVFHRLGYAAMKKCMVFLEEKGIGDSN